MGALAGMKALVVGIANDQSIAWGCARAFRDAGAEVAVTYLNERARPHVAPLAEAVAAPILMPFDVTDGDQEAALFDAIAERWGRLDILLHSIAFAPRDDLHGRVIDSSPSGFGLAMDISVHSFLRLMRRAEPLMTAGGTCLTVSYYGAEKVIANYNMMGPVKAALEAAVRYGAAELGPKGITVHALSPGPVLTRAASGIAAFGELIGEAEEKAPLHHLATIEDVGAYATFLAGPGARRVTGLTHLIDGGASITG